MHLYCYLIFNYVLYKTREVGKCLLMENYCCVKLINNNL